MGEWECFCDHAYYERWAVKPFECGDFHQTIHVNTKEEAEFLVERLNSTVPLSVVEDAYKQGYEKGHHDTVEGGYNPDLSAEDYIKEIKQKAGVCYGCKNF